MNQNNNAKNSFVEKLFYSNRFLLVFSIVVAIAFWAVIKINYSENTTRIISDVQISMQSIYSTETDYVAFYDQDDLTADIEISGSAYDINQYNLDRDDITIEVKSDYVYQTGYRILNLSAKIDSSVNGNVEVVNINPSSITVYYDRESTSTYNVIATIDKELENLVEGNYNVGQPIASVSTAIVSGPASILEKIDNVYLEAAITEDILPLTSTVQVPAKISYGLSNESDTAFLTCEDISKEDENAATVTIPVYILEDVETTVNFVNQPSHYNKNLPKTKINPSKVEVLYNSTDDAIDNFNVGTVDFKSLENKVNVIEFELPESNGLSLTDKNIKTFSVEIDLSNLSKKVIEEAATKVVLLNQNADYNYSIDFDKSKFKGFSIIGPKASLDKITIDDLQVEVNVSELSLARSTSQQTLITNISINNSKINDCWVVGEYYANISVQRK